jgi:transposase
VHSGLKLTLSKTGRHHKSSDPVATIGLDIGKNTFHLVGLDKHGAIAMRIKVSRNQLVHRLANLPPCLIGMEAGSGSHHIARQIEPLGHDVRLIPAQYVKPFLKGHKNDFRDAEAISEAVQRPTMHFVAIKTPEQSDLLSLHRVRSRLVRQRTAIINQIRGFLLERGITVRQGPAPLPVPAAASSRDATSPLGSASSPSRSRPAIAPSSAGFRQTIKRGHGKL